MDTEAYYPPVITDADQPDVYIEEAKDGSKQAAVLALVLDLLLYTGELIVPILLWSCVIAILAGYIQRSNWKFGTRMVFYAIIAFVCLFFLLVRHGANHVIAKDLARSV